MYTNESSYFDSAMSNPDVWANWIAQWNPGDAQEIAQSYWRNCAVVGINPELCLAQSSLETAHWTSPHYVNEHNMAGVGITGDGVQGVDFGSIDAGVKGHIAHLCAYIFGPNDDPQPALADNDPTWRDIRGGSNGHNSFHDGIHYIHTLEQPYTNNEGTHQWAYPGTRYVPTIVSLANLVVGAELPPVVTPTPPPVVFPSAQPTILVNDTHVNVWDEGAWPGRASYPVRALVLHVMAGSYAGSINWFHNPAAQASANYCVSYTGEITETVNPDTEAPWANGISNPNNTALPPGLADLRNGNPNANWVTVSIETEGGSPDEAGYPRAEEYASVVNLMAWLCHKYQLHPSTDTICRHTYFDTVNRPHCPGDHWDFNKLIADVLSAMNIPTPINPNDPMGVESADGVYRTFNFIPGNPTLGHAIYQYWKKDGVSEGIWKYGYPLTSEEQYLRSDGTSITCNWCERSRLEWHPEFQGTENEVEEGLIGEEMMKLHGVPIPGAERTSLAIDSRVQSYYNQHGGLRHFGYPLSDVVTYPNDTIIGQWFERAYIEIHPDGMIVGRRLGAELLERK